MEKKTIDFDVCTQDASRMQTNFLICLGLVKLEVNENICNMSRMT